MRAPVGIAIFLLLVASIGLAGPLLAASVGCEEDADWDCCGLEGATCPCCWRGPQIHSSEPIDSFVGEPGARLGPDERVEPREALPRDILHVPRSASLH